MEPSGPRRKVTIRQLQEMKRRGEPIVAIDVYDSVMAGIADDLGVDMLMTGPAGPMRLFGQVDVTQIGFEEQILTLQAVTRVARYPLISAHMPYMTYQASARDAVLNAGRLVSEGGADTVKCDANRHLADNMRAIVASGIPVIAHLGVQASRRVEQSGGGPKGVTAEEAGKIMDDAAALVDAGVFALLVENTSADLTARLARAFPVPVLSLGSGPDADGACIVSGDAVNLGAEIDRSLRDYAQAVREGRYPDAQDAPRMPPDQHAEFLKRMSRKHGRDGQ